jgi:hypothetical protein
MPGSAAKLVITHTVRTDEMSPGQTECREFDAWAFELLNGKAAVLAGVMPTGKRPSSALGVSITCAR